MNDPLDLTDPQEHVSGLLAALEGEDADLKDQILAQYAQAAKAKGEAASAEAWRQAYIHGEDAPENANPQSPARPRSGVKAPVFKDVLAADHAATSPTVAAERSFETAPMKLRAAGAAAESPTKAGSVALRDLQSLMSDLEAQLEFEHTRRTEAEARSKSMMELSQSLSGQVEGLQGEVERLQMVLRRFDFHSAESAEECRDMADLFTRMAAEALEAAAAKELLEKEREDEVHTSAPSPQGALAKLQKEKEQQDELEFQKTQASYMTMM